MSSGIERPQMILPEAEAEALRVAFAAAGVILEYGSGGSTVLAAEMPGKVVFSVESDPDWLAMMRSWFEANPPQAQLVLHHGDIGPTKAWGKPKDNAAFQKWPGYPISVWDRPDFVHPDLVLIDELHTPNSSRFWRVETYDERFEAGEEPESLDRELIRL